MWRLIAQALLVSGQTWCGYPECPAKPECSNAELDMIIALDESCSMSSTNFTREVNFAKALANASELNFRVSRFAGIRFGYSIGGNCDQAKTKMSSRIVHSMQSGAQNFSSSLSGAFNCGGTPTDEAIMLFHSELAATKVGNRLQVAVLMTDGIPSLCTTGDKSCTGCNTPPKATNAAIAQRENATGLVSTGALVFTIGIGSDIETNIGTTTYGANTRGSTVLLNFASSPRFAFRASSFEVLLNDTLPKVLDLLCFYVIDVVSPTRSSCYESGTNFTIKGYNIFEMSGSPVCRWNEVGTNNFITTPALITETNETYLNQPGVVSLIECEAPAVPYDLFNAYLEVSRDGTYFTSNQYSVLLRTNCNAPVPPPRCPNGTIANLFAACSVSEITSEGCSNDCKDASILLGNSFEAKGMFPAFTRDQIRACLMNYPVTGITVDDKELVLARTAPGVGPCSGKVFSGANIVSALSVTFWGVLLGSICLFV